MLRLLSPCRRPLAFGVAILAFTVLGGSVRATAQEAGCPRYTTIDHWPGGSASNPTKVTYAFDASIDPAAVDCPGSKNQRQQIEEAITRWNTANQTNGSYVQFVPASGAAQLTFTNSDTPLLTTVANGSTRAGAEPKVGADARYTITFYPKARCNISSGGLLSSCYYPEACDLVWRKVALHEIGHTMGLCDIGANALCQATSCDGTGRGKSVMDRFPCGTDNWNVVRKFQSAEISDCDQSAVRLAFTSGASAGGGSSCAVGL